MQELRSWMVLPRRTGPCPQPVPVTKVPPAYDVVREGNAAASVTDGAIGGAAASVGDTSGPARTAQLSER